MKRLWILFILVFVLSSLVCAAGCGCGDDDDDDDSSSNDDDDDDNDDDNNDDDNDDDSWPDNDHIEAGKKYLEASAAGYAANEFNLALDEVPGHPDAYYGLILANTIYEFDVISLIVSYVHYFLGFDEPAKADESLQDMLDEILEQVMQGLVFQHHDELIDSYENWVAEDYLRTFELEKMPLIVHFETLAEPGGLYDASEARAAYAISSGITGVIHHLTALNVDLDLAYIFYIMDVSFGSYDTMEIISIIVDFALSILNDPAFPNFLTFGTDGVEEMKQGGLELGLGLMQAKGTFATMRLDYGEQEVLGFDDKNGNHHMDDGENFIVPPWGILSDDQQAVALVVEDLFGKLAASFLDYTPYDVDPDNPSPFHLAELNSLLAAFGLPRLIPQWDALLIDFGAMYVDPDPNFIRDELLSILNILDLVLPDPPPYK